MLILAAHLRFGPFTLSVSLETPGFTAAMETSDVDHQRHAWVDRRDLGRKFLI